MLRASAPSAARIRAGNTTARIIDKKSVRSTYAAKRGELKKENDMNDTELQEVMKLTDKIARLQGMVDTYSEAAAALRSRVGKLEIVYKKHTESAKKCNFDYCGCDWCEAYRAILEAKC